MLPWSSRWRFRILAGFTLTLGAAAAFAAEAAFQIADAKGQPVADAVVSLVPLDAPPPKVTPGPTVEITQQEKQFVPRVTAIAAGTSVWFTNREPNPKLTHQIYSQTQPKVFEIPLHKPGHSAAVAFETAGVVVIGCSIHDTMSAHIVVLDTPWFVQSAASGAAIVREAPAGRYRATIWHARLETPQVRELTLPAPGTHAVALPLKPEPKARRILDAGGGSYK